MIASSSSFLETILPDSTSNTNLAAFNAANSETLASMYKVLVVSTTIVGYTSLMILTIFATTSSALIFKESTNTVDSALNPSITSAETVSVSAKPFEASLVATATK